MMKRKGKMLMKEVRKNEIKGHSEEIEDEEKEMGEL
jgi:hypothetical protein